MASLANIDMQTVAGFGEEWTAFDQSALPEGELQRLFDAYFEDFDFNPNAEGFDLGCGSGRWADFVAPRVRKLHCIDPSFQALGVARTKLRGHPNVHLHLACAESIPLADESQDFGYSLGVLHHIPDPEAAMREAVQKLRPGAPFLVYLYYSFDNRPAWFRALWRVSDLARKGICRLPFPIRKAVTNSIAATIYWPLAKLSEIAEKAGLPVSSFPLSAYRHSSLYSMRTDALDRFGTILEQRFTKAEIQTMMERCGLERISFSGKVFWAATGYRASIASSSPS